MNFLKKVTGTLKEIRSISRNKWETLNIAFDFIYCKLRFHITVREYKKYKFYNLKNRYRKKFLLIYHKTHLGINIRKRYYTASKYLVYKRIGDLYSREIILVPNCGEDCFVAFLKKHQKVVLKPDSGSWGIDVKILEYTDEIAAQNCFKELSLKKATICEEYICQHHMLAALNPFSTNTLRVVTILDNGNVEIVCAALKTGGFANNFVDNMHNGGIGMQVDIETGITTTVGKDYNDKEYIYHPISQEQLIGFRVPCWDKVKQLVKEAHLRLPETLLFGWDIAITEEGPVIVEVNGSPGPMLMQVMDGIPKGEKIIKMMKTIKVPQEYSKKAVYIPNYDDYI